MGTFRVLALLVLASLYVALGFPISCSDVEIIDSVILTKPKEKRWPGVSELDSLLPENVFVAKKVDWSTISTEGVKKTHKQVVTVNGHDFSFEHNVVRAWVASSKDSEQEGIVLLVASRFAKAARDSSLSDIFGKHLEGQIISVEDAKQAIERAYSGVHLRTPKKLLRYAKTPEGSCEFRLLYAVYGKRTDGTMVRFELDATNPDDLLMLKVQNKKHATLLRSSSISKRAASTSLDAKMSDVVLGWHRAPNAYTLSTDGAAITDHTTIGGWHVLHYRHAGAVQVETKSEGQDIKIQDNQDPLTAGNCLTGAAYADNCPSTEAAIITHHNAVHAYHFFRDEYGWVLRDHFPDTPAMVVDIDDNNDADDSYLTHSTTHTHGARITIGAGEQGETYGRGVDAGLVGHEFAHAVWLAEHGFANGQGTDGVEEAFCDIMGLRVKARANAVGDSWGIHADLYLPPPNNFNACPANENGDDNDIVGCINRDRDFSLPCHGDADVVVFPRPYKYYRCPGGATMFGALAHNAADPHVQGLIIGHWYYRMRHVRGLPNNIADRMLIPFSLTTGATNAPYLEFAQWTLYWLRVRAAYYGDHAYCQAARVEWLTLGFVDGDLPQCP